MSKWRIMNGSKPAGKPGGRLVWITGASYGLGREVALQLARRGDRVAVSARSIDKLNALAAEAPEGRILPYELAIRLARLERAGLVLVIGLLFLIPFGLAQFGIHFPITEWVILAPVEYLARGILTVSGVI